MDFVVNLPIDQNFTTVLTIVDHFLDVYIHPLKFYYC